MNQHNKNKKTHKQAAFVPHQSPTPILPSQAGRPSPQKPSERPVEARPDIPSAPTQTAEPSKAAEERSISFDEVYQDGNAKYKHTIVEYPPSSRTWYILRCDEHGVHFGPKPLLGAAKHLHSIQHNNLPKHHSLAIELIGHRVRDCNMELAFKNNMAVRKAFSEGYAPFNVNRLTRQEKIQQ